MKMPNMDAAREAAGAALSGARQATAGRMAGWLWATIPAVILIGLVNVDALGGLLRVLAKVTMGAWLGYWIDRAAFREGRPHLPLEAAVRASDEGDHDRHALMIGVTCVYMIRRALIVGASVLGAAIGV